MHIPQTAKVGKPWSTRGDVPAVVQTSTPSGLRIELGDLGILLSSPVMGPWSLLMTPLLLGVVQCPRCLSVICSCPHCPHCNVQGPGGEAQAGQAQVRVSSMHWCVQGAVPVAGQTRVQPSPPEPDEDEGRGRYMVAALGRGAPCHISDPQATL